MSDMTHASPQAPVEPGEVIATAPDHAVAHITNYPLLALRGAIGGTLMGLANLVPGISGGTMLLATGVYPGFVGAIAELTTLRFRLRSLLLLGAIGLSASLAILLFAGGTKELVVNHRWAMYSVFIGLTLGGAPLVWRLGRPATPSFFAGAALTFLVMVAMAFTSAQGGDGSESPLVLLLAGLAGASAMILPGVSGGYILLLMGQYVPILSAVDTLKTGLLGDSAAGTGFDLSLVLQAMRVVVPVGIGVVAGVVGVSNLLEWLLRRFEKPTLGALFGLLIGAVAGLWPFQQAVAPATGTVIRGVVVTPETLPGIDVEHWPVAFFSPTGGQMLAAVALIVAGFVLTTVIDRVGSKGQHI